MLNWRNFLDFGSGTQQKVGPLKGLVNTPFAFESVRDNDLIELLWLIADVNEVNTKRLVNFNAQVIPSLLKADGELLKQWSETTEQRGKIDLQVKDKDGTVRAVHRSFEQMLRIGHMHAS